MTWEYYFDKHPNPSFRQWVAHTQCSKKIIKALLACIFFFFVILDPLTTYIGIQGGLGEEANPIAQSLLYKDAPWQNWYLMIGFKFVFYALCATAHKVGAYSRSKTWFCLLAAFAVISIAVVTNNITKIALA